MLVLLDIDGTLVRDAAGAHRLALATAIGQVHGTPPPAAPTQTAGRTDRWIIRDMLSREALLGVDVDEHMDAVCHAASLVYGELCEPSLAACVISGVPQALDALTQAGHRLALVTGNLEPIARLKLARAGLGRWLDGAPGAFASDHELRARLPGIARARAGRPGPPVRRADAVVVGDTPLDVACAHADGLRCVAVATGGFSARELRAAGADAVAASLPAAVGLVPSAVSPRR